MSASNSRASSFARAAPGSARGRTTRSPSSVTARRNASAAAGVAGLTRDPVVPGARLVLSVGGTGGTALLLRRCFGARLARSLPVASMRRC